MSKLSVILDRFEQRVLSLAQLAAEVDKLKVTDVPDPMDVKRYIALVEKAVVVDGAKVVENTINASSTKNIKDSLDMIHAFLIGDDVCFTGFVNLKPLLATQLVSRVCDFKLIDQENEPFCGANVFVYALAQRNIFEYVKFAIELAVLGIGNLGQLRIQPSSALKARLAPRRNEMNIEEIDLIVMGSMRDCISTVSILLPEKDSTLLSGYTTPPQLCQWLTQSGYGLVIDRTLLGFGDHEATIKNHYAATKSVVFNNNLRGDSTQHIGFATSDAGIRYSKANSNLRDAKGLINMGHKVFMLHDGYLTRIALGWKQVDAQRNYDVTKLHWALLQSVSFQGQSVVVDLVSWGGRSNNAVIPVMEFFRYYRGFVAGQP